MSAPTNAASNSNPVYAGAPVDGLDLSGLGSGSTGMIASPPDLSVAETGPSLNYTLILTSTVGVSEMLSVLATFSASVWPRRDLVLSGDVSEVLASSGFYVTSAVGPPDGTPKTMPMSATSNTT